METYNLFVSEDTNNTCKGGLRWMGAQQVLTEKKNVLDVTFSLLYHHCLSRYLVWCCDYNKNYHILSSHLIGGWFKVDPTKHV